MGKDRYGAARNLGRIKAATKAGSAYKKGPFAPKPPAATASSRAAAGAADTKQIRERQRAERIPEGNVRRGKLQKDEVRD